MSCVRPISRFSLVLALACLLSTACSAATRPVPEKHAPETAPSQPPDEPPGEPAASDKDGEYIEYRYLPELGQLVYSDNTVRGVKSVHNLKVHASLLADRGIYAFADESNRHVYRQSQKVAQRTVESAVVIDPPSREGGDGDNFTARLLVKVDGRKKIDCTIGTTGDGELCVNKVVIHVDDGSVEIRALSGDGNEMSIPEAQESLDDPRVITDQSFYDDDPASGGGPVKV
jgi:hypothetical protein